MQLRTIAASLAATAVAGGLALTATPAHASAANPQLLAAKTWLVDQLGGATSDHAGLLPYSIGGADYGASADAIISLAMIQDTTDASTIANALANHVDDYISDSSDPGSTYAGSVAKAAVALTWAGLDPTDVNGENLITRLEAQVQPSGRIQDTTSYGDFETVLGQAFAVDALTQAGSPDAADATTFLLSQQCSAGWFRQGFDQTTDASGNPVGTDETCDADPSSTPSVDATATALIELAPQVDDGTASAAVTSAVDKAKTWLLSVQHKDGGWTDGGAGDAENANSTGLAGLALARIDPTDAAPAGVVPAATWLGARQLENVGGCTPYAKADLGAIAYDPTAWTTAQKRNVGTANDQYIVAATQSMALLGAAPTSAVTPSVSAPKSAGAFAKAGSTRGYRVGGLDGSRPTCVSDSRSSVLLPGDTAGTAKAILRFRATTGTETVKATPATGTTARTTTRVLAAKRLKVTAPKTVRAGGSLRVKVAGLAKGEMVTIEVRGKVAAGVVAKSTSLTKAVKVRGKGTAKITVTGQFADRTGSTTVTVK